VSDDDTTAVYVNSRAVWWCDMVATFCVLPKLATN